MTPRYYLNNVFDKKTIKQQAITWASGDPDLYRYMAPQGHNELTGAMNHDIKGLLLYLDWSTKIE